MKYRLRVEFDGRRLEMREPEEAYATTQEASRAARQLNIQLKRTVDKAVVVVPYRESR